MSLSSTTPPFALDFTCQLKVLHWYLIILQFLLFPSSFFLRSLTKMNIVYRFIFSQVDRDLRNIHWFDMNSCSTSCLAIVWPHNHLILFFFFFFWCCVAIYAPITTSLWWQAFWKWLQGNSVGLIERTSIGELGVKNGGGREGKYDITVGESCIPKILENQVLRIWSVFFLF